MLRLGKLTIALDCSVIKQRPNLNGAINQFTVYHFFKSISCFKFLIDKKFNS